MWRRDQDYFNLVRWLTALTGGAIGVMGGMVWLRASLVEALACGAVGLLLASMLGRAAQTPASGDGAPSNIEALVATEGLMLAPMLSWPAPFPAPLATRPRLAQRGRARALRRAHRCSTLRRRTSGRLRGNRDSMVCHG